MKKWILGLTVAAGFAVIWYSSIRRQSAPKKSVSKEISAEAQQYSDLIQLAQGTPGKDALRQAVDFSNSPSATLRESAALALGFLPGDEAYSRLKALVSDSNSGVRIAALQSLAKSEVAERWKYAWDFATKSSRSSPNEKFVVFAQLLQNKGSIALMPSVVEKCLALSRDKRTKNYDLGALRTLSTLSRPFSSVEVLFKDVLADANASEEAKTMAIQYFILHRSKWVNSQSLALFEKNGETVRRMMLENLHILCPDDSFKIVGKALQSDNFRDIALHTLARIGGQKSAKFAIEAANDMALPSSLRETLKAQTFSASSSCSSLAR